MRRLSWLLGGVCVALLSFGVYHCWCQRTLLAFCNQERERQVDFVVYRAYQDAQSDTVRGILQFAVLKPSGQTSQVGTLTVLAASFTPNSRSDLSDYASIYNWHKSRAAFRILQTGNTPEKAAELLDALERLRVLTHAERLAVGDIDVIDPYPVSNEGR